MASGENGPLGLNAPYPAPMEPNIEHAPVLDHSMRERIVPETTVKQQTAFQKSVQSTVCGTNGCSGVIAPCLVVTEPETVPVHAKVHIIKEKNAMDQRMKPSLVTHFPVQLMAHGRRGMGGRVVR